MTRRSNKHERRAVSFGITSKPSPGHYRPRPRPVSLLPTPERRGHAGGKAGDFPGRRPRSGVSALPAVDRGRSRIPASAGRGEAISAT